MAAAVAPGLPPRRSLRGVLIASAGCFLALALAVGFMPSLPGDTAVREALLALASPPVLAAMRLINRAGSWQLLLPGSLLLLLAFRRARERELSPPRAVRCARRLRAGSHARFRRRAARRRGLGRAGHASRLESGQVVGLAPWHTAASR